jgi:hypothetical protein
MAFTKEVDRLVEGLRSLETMSSLIASLTQRSWMLKN